MVRARTPINYARVKELAWLQCPDAEIADSMGIDPAAFSRRKKTDKQLREALRKGRADGKIAIRGYQLKSAKEGKPTVLIWLGKQSLGQTDKPVDESESARLDKVDELNARIDAMAGKQESG
jgi:hypothetical protein